MPDGLQAASVSVMAAAPTSKALTLYYTAQIKSYFCGPAAAYMILREEGLTTARDGTGRVLTQTNLALTDYLATERDGATKWIGGRMALGVNKRSGNNWYLQLQSPTAGQVQGALLDTIGVNGKAIGGDTVEVAGGPHYNGHPNKLIGHWLAGYGYSSSGATTLWADLSTSYYTGGAKTFSTNTTSFTNTYLQTNGIMY